MKKGDIVYNQIFGYGVIEEVSEKSCKIKFDSLNTIRTIKTGYFKKVT